MLSNVRVWFTAIAFTLAGCAGDPNNIIGIDSLKTPAASVAGTTRHTIFVATTRALADDPAILFSGERLPESVNLARVEVSVPPSHKTGAVERPSRVPPDPKKDFVVLNPSTFDSQSAFKQAVDRELASRPRGQRDILLFVHGYNTDLAGAVLRMGQFVHDSGFSGVPVLFSWASRGKTLDYVYDLNSALHARDELLETALSLATTRTEGVNIVAHSMGNFLTVEAMRQAQLTGKFNKHGKLRTVILASPDIDADVFAKQLAPFPKSERRFYVLVSQDDKALAVSRRLAGGVDRVGDEDSDRLAKLGVRVIDLSEVDDTSSLNHTKFADSPGIVKLIGKRMNEGDSFRTHAGPTVFGGVASAAQVLASGGRSVLVVGN